VNTLRITETAALAIVEQADYYLQESDGALAQRWSESVDRAMHSLLQFPERGALCHFRSASLEGMRWIFVPGFKRHIVFYRFLREEHVVLVVHVLHSSRNLRAIFAEGS